MHSVINHQCVCKGYIIYVVVNLHYASIEGMAWLIIFSGCGYRLSDELQPWPKLTNQCTFMNTAGHNDAV